MTNAALGTRTVEYTFEGQTYHLSPFDLEDYGSFETWLEKNLWAALRRAADAEWITAAEYREYRHEAMTILAARELSFGADAYLRGTQTVPGLEEQLRLSFAHTQPVAPDIISRMVREDLTGVVNALQSLNVSP